MLQVFLTRVSLHACPSQFVKMSPEQVSLLHCLKYSGQDVYGIFLGSNNCVKKCVPLFHSSCVSVPILRTCLSLVDEIEDLDIVGIYFASLSDEKLSPLARWIFDEITRLSPDRPISVFKYDAQITIEKGLAEYPFVWCAIEAKSSKRAPETSFSLDKDSLKAAVESESYLHDIVDFEDFLANPSLEWIK